LKFHLDLLIFGLPDYFFLGDVIVQESKFSPNAKVRNCKQNNLLHYGISAQLMGVVSIQVHFIATQRLKVHDIADVQIEDPILLLLSDQKCLDISSQRKEIHVVDELSFLLLAVSSNRGHRLFLNTWLGSVFDEQIDRATCQEVVFFGVRPSLLNYAWGFFIDKLSLKLFIPLMALSEVLSELIVALGTCSEAEILLQILVLLLVLQEPLSISFYFVLN